MVDRTRAIAAAMLAIVTAAGAVAVYAFSGRPDARQALIDSLVTLRAGNYSAARNNAQIAVRAAPGSGMAHAILARAHLQLGDGLAAEAALGRARGAGLPRARLYQLAAQAAFLQGNYPRAMAEAGRAAPRYADYAARVAARARAMQGDSGAAVAMLATIAARRPGDAGVFVDLGRVMLSAGDNRGAADAAARAVALAPGDPVALTLQGEVVRLRYGLVASLPWFQAALKRDAYYHPALIEYAATLGEAGQYRAMLAMTRRAKAARPGSPQASFLQALLAARAGRTELARDLLGRSAGAIDELPGAILLSGSLDLAEGKIEQAIAMFRRVVAMQPMNIGARRLLGSALLRSGDAGAALAMLRPIVSRGDADSYTVSLAARAFEAAGNRAAAAAMLDRAALARPEVASVFASDASIAAIGASAARAPDDPNYVPGLIRAEFATGNALGALARAQSLAAAGSGAAAAHLALGDALMVSARYRDAAAAFTRAADLAFDEPTMLRLVGSLERAGALYRGPLLDAHDTDAADELEDWLQAERQRWIPVMRAMNIELN